MDSDDLDENILLNSDYEEGGTNKHAYHNAIDEEELLYEDEGDDDILESEADDVLELALEDDELDTPDQADGSNDLSPIKVRSSLSGHGHEFIEEHEHEEQLHHGGEEEEEELTHEEFVDDNNESPPLSDSAKQQQTVDSDDDDDSPRTRGRFLTERKTEDISSNTKSMSGGGGSEGMPITSLGERNPRPPFYPESRRGGNRGGFNNNMNRGHHHHHGPRSFPPPRYNMNPNLRHRQPSLLGSGPRPALLRYPNYNQQMQQALHNEATVRQLQGGFIDFNQPLRPQGINKQNQQQQQPPSQNQQQPGAKINKVSSPAKPQFSGPLGQQQQQQQQQQQDKQSFNSHNNNNNNPNQKQPLINSPKQQQQQQQISQQQQQQQQPAQSNQMNQKIIVTNTNNNLIRNPNVTIPKRPLAPRIPQQQNPNMRPRPRIPSMGNPNNQFLSGPNIPGQQQQQQRPPLIRPGGGPHRQRHPHNMQQQQNRPHFPGQNHWRPPPNSPQQQMGGPRMPPPVPGGGPPEQEPYGGGNFGPGNQGPILMGPGQQQHQHPPNYGGGPNDPNIPPNNFQQPPNIRQPFIPPMQQQQQHQQFPPQEEMLYRNKGLPPQQQQPPHFIQQQQQPPPQQQGFPQMQEPIPPHQQNNPFYGARPEPPEMHHRISQMNYNPGGHPGPGGGRHHEDFRYPVGPPGGHPGQVPSGHLHPPPHQQQQDWPLQQQPHLPPPQQQLQQGENMGIPPQYQQGGEMRPPLHFPHQEPQHYQQQQQPPPPHHPINPYLQVPGRRMTNIPPESMLAQHHHELPPPRNEGRGGYEINERLAYELEYDAASNYHSSSSASAAERDFLHERDYDLDRYDSYEHDRHPDNKLRFRDSSRSNDEYRHDRLSLKRTAEFKDEHSHSSYGSPEKRLQGRLGPPVPKRRSEDPRKQEVIKIIKESQKVMGLDADYLEKMEEQKRLRDRILREKEERRKHQQLSSGGDESQQQQQQQHHQQQSQQNYNQSPSPPRPGPSAAGKNQLLQRREVRLTNKGTSGSVGLKKQQQGGQSVSASESSNMKLQGKPGASSKSIYVNPKTFKGDLSVLSSNLKKINMKLASGNSGSGGGSARDSGSTSVTKVVSSTSTTKKTNTSKVLTTKGGLPAEMTGIGPTTKKKTILRIVRNKKGEIISKTLTKVQVKNE